MSFCPFKISSKSRKSINRPTKSQPEPNQNNNNNNNLASDNNTNQNIINNSHQNTNHNHQSLHNGNNNATNFGSLKQNSHQSNHHHSSNNNNNRNSDTPNGKGNNNPFNPLDGDIKHAINLPYRYVIAQYHSREIDELTVMPGDLVLLEYTDSSIETGDWSHVLRIGTNKRGFVPSHILTADVRRNPIHKKKMPHSMDDPCQQHRHLHVPQFGQHHHHHHGGHHQASHHHHPHRTPQLSAQPSPTNGETGMCLHPIPRFGIPHSLEGSSGGKQSFQNFNTPAYYNLISPDPTLEHDFIPFHREMFGRYVVIYNFVAREENDLSVKPGDYVTLLNKDDPDWYWIKRECDHAEGFVPARFIGDYEQVKSLCIKMECVYANKQSLN